MARDKAKPVEALAEAPLNSEALNTAQNLMAAVQADYTEERDLVNQLLGQAQMADAFGSFCRTVRLSKLAFVKENKLYRALAGKLTPNGSALSGTWEEFCELLGSSKDKVDLDLQNLRAFGEEALDSMSRMGIGYRELRQYRRLPEDQQLALIEVAKAGDKEAFVDLAEEIIAKHAREKEDLTAKLTDTTGNYEAQAELLADTRRDLDTAKTALRKAKRLSAEATPDEVSEKLQEEVAHFAFAAEAAVNGDLRLGVDALMEHAHETGRNPRAFLAGLLLQLERSINEIRVDHNIPLSVTADVRPELAQFQE